MNEQSFLAALAAQLPPGSAVPTIGKPINVRKTLDLPCYAAMPADEREYWLSDFRHDES